MLESFQVKKELLGLRADVRQEHHYKLYEHPFYMLCFSYTYQLYETHRLTLGHPSQAVRRRLCGVADSPTVSIYLKI